MSDDRPQIQQIIVQIASPKDSYPGAVTYGYYTVVDNLLTMTTADGMPIRRPNGEHYTHKIEPGEDPRRMANALTKQVRSSIHGSSDFNRRDMPPMTSVYGAIV